MEGCLLSFHELQPHPGGNSKHSKSGPTLAQVAGVQQVPTYTFEGLVLDPHAAGFALSDLAHKQPLHSGLFCKGQTWPAGYIS